MSCIGRRMAASDTSTSRVSEDVSSSHDLAPAFPSKETINPQILVAVDRPPSNHSTNAAKMHAPINSTQETMEAHGSSPRLVTVDLPRSWATEDCSGFSYSKKKKEMETFSRPDSPLCSISNLVGRNTENDNIVDHRVENENEHGGITGLPRREDISSSSVVTEENTDEVDYLDYYAIKDNSLGIIMKSETVEMDELNDTAVIDDNHLPNVTQNSKGDSRVHSVREETQTVGQIFDFSEKERVDTNFTSAHSRGNQDVFRKLNQTFSETIQSSKDLQQTHPALIRMLEDVPPTSSQYAKPNTHFSRTSPSEDTYATVNSGHLLRLMGTLSKISEIQEYIAANIPKTLPFYQTEDLFGHNVFTSSSNGVGPCLHKAHRTKSPLHSHRTEPFTSTSRTSDSIPTSTRENYCGASDEDHMARINRGECTLQRNHRSRTEENI